jgi:MSHA pilin protein MshC
MKRGLRQTVGNGGFTMIEVVCVLVLIAILGVVALSRYQGNVYMNIVAKQEILKSHIRYAQSRSMNSNLIWGIQFNAGNTYSLFAYDSDASGLINPAPKLPDNNITSLPMPPETTASAAGVIAFDFFGRPYYAANLSSPGTLTQTAYNGQITIKDITITPETGFVP